MLRPSSALHSPPVDALPRQSSVSKVDWQEERAGCRRQGPRLHRSRSLGWNPSWIPDSDSSASSPIGPSETTSSPAISSPPSSRLPLRPPSGPADPTAGPPWPPPASPALSTASTADGDGGCHHLQDGPTLDSSPPPPLLTAPSLPGRARDLLRTPPAAEEDESQFATASWGSPYPRSDQNLLRRQSFGSDPSDDSPPLHRLNLDTPFLRSRPGPSLPPLGGPSALSAAAAVLAKRARRQTSRGLTEDWIRTHTAGALNVEPRNWFSDGSDSEHSSLPASDSLILDDGQFRTPKPTSDLPSRSSPLSRHSRGRSSLETLRPQRLPGLRYGKPIMEPAPPPSSPPGLGLESPSPSLPPSSRRLESAEPTIHPGPDGASKLPTTPPNRKHARTSSPQPHIVTPRLRKKVPWKGKNIMISVPRDDGRGLPGKRPMPLGPGEIAKMFASWKDLGYSVDGFDLLVDGYHPPGTADSQSRLDWPTADDVARERAQRPFKVTLPDLNAWKDYVNGLQEAKLRALGVSLAEEDPETFSASPPTDPSRQPSAQYPPLPFSPPVPTSSASSNPAHSVYSLPAPLLSAMQSPALPPGASPVPFAAVPERSDPRQSISLPSSVSPFRLSSHQPPQGWPHPLVGGLPQQPPDSLSPATFGGGPFVAPPPPRGIETAGHTDNVVLGSQQLHRPLQDLPQTSQSKASPPARHLAAPEAVQSSAAEIMAGSRKSNPSALSSDDAQPQFIQADYHLEEQMRHQFEHEDYNPQPRPENLPTRSRAASSAQAVPSLSTSDPQSIVLHHPRPQSRDRSLSQTFFRAHGEDRVEGAGEEVASRRKINSLGNARGSWDGESNYGNIDASAQRFDMFGPEAGPRRQQTLPATSNPWQTTSPATAAPGPWRPGHGSRVSISKLNVEAPEFKFDPATSVAPGLFDFSGGSNGRPAFGRAGNLTESLSGNSISRFSATSNFHAAAPSFSPGRSEFSFSTPGPKFRPDAPAFTPSHHAAAAAADNTATTSPAGSASDAQSNRNSIFGNIQISASDIIRPVKKSKAIPIVRPSSRSSVKSTEASIPADGSYEGSDGRLANESRAKRARNSSPVPRLYSPIPRPREAKEERSDLDDISALEGENPLPADTSLSSVITSDHEETKATTEPPSEASPMDAKDEGWTTLSRSPRADLQPTELSEAPAAASNGEASSADEELTSAAPATETKRPLAVISHNEETTRESDGLSGPTSPDPRPRLVPKGLGLSPQTARPPKLEGLAGSRFAGPTSPASPPDSMAALQDDDDVVQSVEVEAAAGHAPDEELVTQPKEQLVDISDARDATFEQIDAVMQHIENDPSMGVNKSFQTPPRRGPIAVEAGSPEQELGPFGATQPGLPSSEGNNVKHSMEGDAVDGAVPKSKTQSEDGLFQPMPNVGSFHFPRGLPYNEGRVGETVGKAVADLTEGEEETLKNMVPLSGGRLNEILETLLATRLGPLERSISLIQYSLASMESRGASTRRDARSASDELQHSDADDEDEEPAPRRSVSPRKDRKMDQIRAAVMEAFAAQQREEMTLPSEGGVAVVDGTDSVLKAVQELKEMLSLTATKRDNDRTQEGTSVADVDLEALLRQPGEVVYERPSEVLQMRLDDVERRLHLEQAKADEEIAARRGAEDAVAELNRKLQAAETRIEVEIINRSAFDQRVADLDDRIRQQDERIDEEVKGRRAAEDRLSEVQRLLRISSEEEMRLREVVEDKDEKIKRLEQAGSLTEAQIRSLQEAQAKSTWSLDEVTGKMETFEAEAQCLRQDNQHWRSEAERAGEKIRRHATELAQIQDEKNSMQKTLSALSLQLEENEKMRESWRSKFLSLQEDMGHAARDVAEENARHIKREQSMLARHDVLNARLQAEAKTRERLEVEMERLQEIERSGMRAVSESKRLEDLLGELRTENHKLQQTAMRYRIQYDEARESAVSETQRTRSVMTAEVEAADGQADAIRAELEMQNAKLRTELESSQLECDRVKAQSEMLLEEARTTKASELEKMQHEHKADTEDLQARHERTVGNMAEDAQRMEQQLLERLSLSTSKIEHLQDRVLHLEEKLEIAKEAAAAAAEAAQATKKPVGAEDGQAAVAPELAKAAAASRQGPPEKISPQALRESIMVLQEQLQAREQRIEELEQVVAASDPEAASKITKRDDEISWLRELLAVRRGELEEVIALLSGEVLNREAVKDAAIRLKANLQMEEQERARAAKGGSSVVFPGLAQSIQSATPRVAQTIGPIAAAWGSWRKSGPPSLRSIGRISSSPVGPGDVTPSRTRDRSAGLLTPPASGLGQSPLSKKRAQPTAFASTGRRFPAQQGGDGPEGCSSSASSSASSSSRPAGEARAEERTPAGRSGDEGRGPATPTMTGPGDYDSDAQPGDFDADDFFEEDD